MLKKLVLILMVVILAISFWRPYQTALANSASQPGEAPVWLLINAKPARLDPALEARVKDLKPAEMITVIVMLREQADLTRVTGDDHDTRERDAVRRLRSTADATQKLLKNLLNVRRGQKKVKNFESLWVINGFSVTATSHVINELAQNPDVLSITTDDVYIVPTALGTPEANITAVGAPFLWNMGIYGQGIVVANMDSGVDVSHPDLASRWRGGTNSWYDPYGQHPVTPTDMTGHGTWTMGVMVGGDAGGTSIGVAPGAQWIAAKIFNDQGQSTATAIHQSFQWLLDPDGDPNTADAPRVVNNSWTYGYPGCNLEFEADLQSLRAAGILPVFAAGNGGPYSNSSYSPANNPSALSVGAINNNGTISSISSRGPNSCGVADPIFPQIVASGVNIRTSDLYGGYYTTTGTSLAAPHVAGGLALLLSAYSNLTASDQQTALLSSTTDLGVAGPDNTYGYGRVDLLAAYNWLGTARPTDTPVPTATPTSVLPFYTPTDTPTPTATPTSLAPTATATSSPVTLTATNTTLPPTFTASPTVLLPTATPTSTTIPPTATYSPTPTAIMPTHTPVPTRTSVPPTATSKPTLTATTISGSRQLHVGNLDRSSIASGRNWNAVVTILVHNGLEIPIANAAVTGKWKNGSTGTFTCITSSNGQCSIIKTGLGSSTLGVSFSVTKITLLSFVYNSSANHDPDGNSNGTTIIIVKP